MSLITSERNAMVQPPKRFLIKFAQKPGLIPRAA